MANNGTTIKQPDGIVECRICGLIYLPELAEDRERHEREHLKILAGALPYRLREFLKKAGWKIIENEDLREPPERIETAKRAVAFAYWARALSNSIPENEMDSFMAAHFAWLDAIGSGDQTEIERMAEPIKRWSKWG